MWREGSPGFLREAIPACMLCMRRNDRVYQACTSPGAFGASLLAVTWCARGALQWRNAGARRSQQPHKVRPAPMHRLRAAAVAWSSQQEARMRQRSHTYVRMHAQAAASSTPSTTLRARGGGPSRRQAGAALSRTAPSLPVVLVGRTGGTMPRVKGAPAQAHSPPPCLPAGAARARADKAASSPGLEAATCGLADRGPCMSRISLLSPFMSEGTPNRSIAAAPTQLHPR